MVSGLLWLASWDQLVAVSQGYAYVVIVLVYYPPCPTDTLLRAIGKRAHALHILSFFSLLCFWFSTIGCVARLLACFVSDGPHPSMIVFNIPPVIPKRESWIVMMFLNGIFALIGQVCSSNKYLIHSWSNLTLVS